LEIEAPAVDGSQGAFGQEVADPDRRRVGTGCRIARDARGCPGITHGAAAGGEQCGIEFRVRELSDVAYPPVAPDDDVRGGDAQMKSGAQTAVVEDDGHGDP